MRDSEAPLDNHVVLDASFVRECVTHLRGRSTHRQFVGYLCICEAAGLIGRTDRLRPAFKGFFDRFLLVGSAPDERPYLVPFNESGNPDANVWFNKNVAGSYAPSSIRQQAPLRRVIDIFGANRQATFSLRDGHEEACLQHLLFEDRMDPLALAGFLFRDHSFALKDDELFTTSTLTDELYALLGFEEGGFDRRIIFNDEESEVAGSLLFNKFGLEE